MIYIQKQNRNSVKFDKNSVKNIVPDAVSYIEISNYYGDTSDIHEITVINKMTNKEYQFLNLKNISVSSKIFKFEVPEKMYDLPEGEYIYCLDKQITGILCVGEYVNKYYAYTNNNVNKNYQYN